MKNTITTIAAALFATSVTATDIATFNEENGYWHYATEDKVATFNEMNGYWGDAKEVNVNSEDVSSYGEYRIFVIGNKIAGDYDVETFNEENGY